MRSKRLQDVRELIDAPEFKAWWQRLVQVRLAYAEAEAAREEALAQLTLIEFRAELTQKNAIDLLYRAGEHEDAAARALAQAQSLENKSFEAVAGFEEQRFKVSELWYRLGAAEQALEQAREQRAEGDLQALERKRHRAADDYEKETATKHRLWGEVERLWARSSEVSLLRSEEQVQARKARKAAEVGFGEAEVRKQQAQACKRELELASLRVERDEAALRATREAANERFGCSLGTDFLYFRLPGNSKHALAVALVEDHDHYNLEVQPLSVYLVERARGAGFLLPAGPPKPPDEEGDLRFEAYFLKGRKGEQPVRSA